mmetsp:Transcript_35951/g.64772  ORF Transcript_35951/g.64772 Transcript_35951/m.64772 type:complete len:99 (-) Transcript_35951:131-427(-)
MRGLASNYLSVITLLHDIFHAATQVKNGIVTILSRCFGGLLLAGGIIPPTCLIDILTCDWNAAMGCVVVRGKCCSIQVLHLSLLGTAHWLLSWACFRP